MVPEPFRVVETRRDTADTWTLGLEAANGAPSPRFGPGQFNMLYAFGVGEVPISISGDPTASGPLEHTVRSVGAASAAICAARPGEVLGVRGPYGSSWPLSRAVGRQLVAVAGGIGLAPLRPAVLAALAESQRYERIVVLYGGRTPDQLLYMDQLERFEANGIDVYLTVDSAAGDWSGHVGLVTTLFDQIELEPERTVAMLCGPEIMMRFAVQALLDRGVNAGDIHVSMERNMKCALTQCGRCVFGPTYVCREGPVMRYSEIERFFTLREV
jgi:NAD(P)H-flavin reductase